MKKALFLILFQGLTLVTSAQLRFINPILHRDYSDPDVCRVGEDYWMTASSFHCFPGLPILHSRDLVHWELVGSALTDYPVGPEVEHGKCVWAPSIRYHNGYFYIFCGDPDRGIFMVRTRDPKGAWEAPVWLLEGQGFIDPCPFWDEDGRAYLSHGCAGSRAGVKSVLFVAEMAPDGTRLLQPSRIVYDGHLTQPTIEGTKFYRRNGYYYIFAPAGGVATGWQTVLRAEHPFGPYDERIVMAWAEGTVNGPHQGAWVETPGGESFFLHFQDKGAYGRIVHLQPLVWRDDAWPLIGEDPDGDGVGQPVSSGSVPMPTSAGEETQGDPYRPYGLPLEWQFPTVPSPFWAYALPGGGIRLYSVQQDADRGSLWNCPNLLLRKFEAETFCVTAQLRFCPNPQLKGHGETAGFVVFGNDYAGLQLTDLGGQAALEWMHCPGASLGKEATRHRLALLSYTDSLPIVADYASRNVPQVRYPAIPALEIWLRLEVEPGPREGHVPDAICRFSYSLDGEHFSRVGQDFVAAAELWVGARWGFYCNREAVKNDAGWLDILSVSGMMPGSEAPWE